MKSTSSPTNEVEIQDPDANLDVSTAPPEKENKIMAAIRSLKNGKALGQDSLHAAQVLQPLFMVI